MKKRSASDSKKSAGASKKAYVTPKLVSYGDFRRVTLGLKGVTDKDSASAPLRTRISGGSHP
jgi:uncharacterized protein DUF5972